jgi:SAM-dependent methyltransferase
VLKVLTSEDEITAARQALDQRGWSVLTPAWQYWPRRIGRKLGLPIGVAVGDQRKSWDVRLTLEALDQYVAREAGVMDLGAFACEIPLAAARLGYRPVTGIDLDPRLVGMPRPEGVRYEVGDFYEPPLPAASLGAVTALSVIEHGFQPERLLTMLARVLRPGGVFLASFDYWPEPIDTSDVSPFGMSWTIFSRNAVEAWLARATSFGLEPLGPLDWQTTEPVIGFAGRRYTFAWLALRKAGVGGT